MFAAEILRKRCFVGGAQGNVKALLRKGTALLTMQEYADAIAALTQVRQHPNHRRHHTVVAAADLNWGQDPDFSGAGELAARYHNEECNPYRGILHGLWTKVQNLNFLKQNLDYTRSGSFWS